MSESHDREIIGGHLLVIGGAEDKYNERRILKKFLELAGGAAVLLVSSDLDEIAGICHRALIFNRGRIVDELQRADMSVARLTALVGGAQRALGIG